MNIFLRFPEQGKEIRITLQGDNTLEYLSQQLLEIFGYSIDAFILLNSDGISLKEKPLNAKASEIIYAFLKDSIITEKFDIKVPFTLINSQSLPYLPGENKGVLGMERNLHKMYLKALEFSDFFTSYSAFAEQIQTEMEIIKSAKVVLGLYHKRYIQDQSENFAHLFQKNLSHYDLAQEEFKAFDEAVEKLGTIRIHSSLRNSSRAFLSDLIDVGQLSRWKESYISEIKRLQQKFVEIEVVINQLPFIYQLPEGESVQVDIVQVPESINSVYKYIIDLYMDYRTLCELYNNSCDGAAGQRLHEEDWKKHSEKASQNLAILNNAMPHYQTKVTDLQDYRKLANQQLFSLLRKITEFAVRIRDSIKSQLSMLSSLLKRSEKRLAFIKVPRLLPEAHQSAVFEISRRNLFVKKASEMQKELNLLIETEIAERVVFLEKFRHVLPNNFVPQLSAGPFLKIVSGPDEQDLYLPAICEELPESFPYKSLYEGSCYRVNKDWLEKQESYERNIEALKIELKETQHQLANSAEESKLKDQENENKVQMLENKLNKHMVLLQNMEFEKKVLEKKETELKVALQELENKLKQLQAKTNTEQSDYIKTLEDKLKLSQNNEIQYKIDLNKANEDLTKILSDIKKKDKSLMDAAESLKDIQDEFKSKDGIIKELKEKLAHLNKKINENNDRSSDELTEKICKELGVSNQDLFGSIKKLKESEMAKIAFTSFEQGSLALFFPTAEGQFLAFNYNCPDHYLNTDALSPQTIEAMHNEPYIVGLIMDKKKMVAGRNNPLNLPQGAEYCLLTIRTEFN